MPAHQLDLQSFVEFVLACSLDNRMTTDAVRGRLTDAGGSSLFQRALLRLGLVDRLKLQTLELRNRIGPILGDAVPRWGRGRVDTFNPYKAIQFNWPLDRLPRVGADRRLGLSVALEPAAARRAAAALGRRQRFGGRAQPQRRAWRRHHAGDGRSRGHQADPRLDLDAAAACRTRIRSIARLPRAARRVYQSACLQCHGDHRFREGVRAGAGLGQVVNASDIGTDRHRLDSYTAAFAANQYSLFPSSPYRFRRFRKTNRLRQPPARRHLGARAVPSQRIGADASRSARAAREAAGCLLPGLRRLRPGACRVRQRRAEERGRSSSGTTRRCRATATPATCTGRRSRTRTKRALVEYLKTF